MRKKLFTFLLALVTSVGLSYAAVDGKLPGAFTVDGSGTQVYFSQGNLQYVGGNWQFADNQWDVIGASQTNSSRDLFGWGTGNNPNQTSDEYEDYTTFADWGSNMGGDWRTLTRDEWLYIFNTRTSASDLRGSATVCGVHGYIILPDNFVLPGGLSWTSRPNNWTTNVYTLQEWSSMEENGAIFLPAAGYRDGTTVYYDESAWGYYWSATEHSQAYYAYSAWVADEDSYVRVYQRDRTYGHSVRLVSETAPSGGSTPSGDKLSGVFSVSGTKAVCFSKGNLQYDSGNQIWQFAANQWDYIGNAAGNNAITSNGIADNNGIVDMFCWVGASSSLEGIKQYGIIKSWSGYGSVAGEALKSDWGNTMGGDWRTLSKDEWIYLLTERTNAANLRTLGTVNGKAGLILMPDGWTASGVSLTVTTANYTTNDINTTNWATLEGQGCAFLPAAGCCALGLFDGVGGDGSYWSSTSHASGATYAHRLHFRATEVDPTNNFVDRFNGMSVRLVSETAPAPANPVIKLNADFGGAWEDTDAFTDNGNGTASWSISTLTAGEWYHFGVKVDGTWTSDNAAFDREHPSRVISGTGDAMWFQADVAGEYTFTWEYATNTLTIGFPVVVPTVTMKGSWDNWTDVVNFTDNGDGTASATKTFEHEGYYTFKTVLNGDDWRGNGEAFKRNYTGAEGIVGNTDMTLWVDAKGEYTFTWTYASNRIDITYPALPTVYLYLNGSADAFTNYGDGTVSYYIHFNSTGSNKEFKIRLGESDWRSNGQAFNPVNTTYDWINDAGGGAYMKIYIDAEADYTLTWTYVENKLEITHPVVPDFTVMTKVDPENPGVYYSTFYSSNYSYKLMDDGTVAFIAKISNGDLVLTQIAEGEQVIPAGTAVIFRKTGSSIPVGLRDTQENNTSFDPADNDLEGVDTPTQVTSIPGLTVNNCYVLSGMSHDESVKGVGFYKIYGTELKDHKAYVKYAGGSNNAPKKMRFVYGQATGIEDVQGNNVQSTKVIENGVLYIIRDGKTYNAMGQMVK